MVIDYGMTQNRLSNALIELCFVALSCPGDLFWFNHSRHFVRNIMSNSKR